MSKKSDSFLKKRKRSLSDTGSKPKKVRKKSYRKFNGVEDADFKRIKPAGVKKELRAMARTFHKMVDSDWHDGYEEQGEYVGEFYGSVEVVVQSVYNVSIVPDLPKEAYERMNESLRLCYDAWNQMNSVPMRGDICDIEMNSEISFSEIGHTETYISINSMLWHVWMIVLCSAVTAEVYTDSELLRHLKNFHDCIGEELYFTDIPEEEHGVVKTGKKHLLKLWKGGERKELDSVMKKHKTKRVIDRRFDGDLNKRTRAYDSEGNYASGCAIQ